MEWAKGYAEKYVEVKEGIAGILSLRELLKVLNLSLAFPKQLEQDQFYRFPYQ
jgi:hypothetical protein